MSFPIGHMSIGDILDRGLKVLLARLPALFTISLLFYVPLMILQMFMPMIVYRQDYDPIKQLIMLMVFSLLAMILSWLLQPFAVAASLHVVACEFLDRQVTIGQALAFALSRFVSLLGAIILWSLILLAPIILGTALATLLAVVMVEALGTLGGILAGFAFLAFFAAGLVGFLLLFVRFNFYAQVVVVEGSPAMASFPRSAGLTEGFRWRVLGIAALLFVISLVVTGAPAIVLNVFFTYMETVEADFQMTQVFGSYRNYLIHLLVQYPLSIVVNAFGAVCWTLFYFDLRNRKEGFDLELAASNN